MKQVIQEVRTGNSRVREIPAPAVSPGTVLVSVMASAISTGTERFVVNLAKQSLLGKARQRPDHVLRTIEKVRQEGLVTTLRQVAAKLDEPMPLGYSAAGVVIACGWDVQEFKPGDRVAVVAPHAGMVCVGKNLCAHIPDGVTFEQAAYTSIAAIALQGVRLSKVSLGDRVLVIGLGLVGQICVSLLKAQGCSVFGTDINRDKLDRARELGADIAACGAPLEEVKAFSRSLGVDASILTAATSSNEPIEFAAEVCRPKGRIVLIGTAGLNVPREPFFKKELEFTVSSSLGAGRGDPVYEEKGIDYPVGYARWTAQRNMQAVLDTMATGKLPVEKLTTHRFPIERAGEAYSLITNGNEPYLGIVIEYPPAEEKPQRRLALRSVARAEGDLGVSLIGAGNFARLVMMPMISKAPAISWRGLCTAKGVNAEQSGGKMGFVFAATEASELWDDSHTKVVLIATRHDLHAELVVAGLRAGKHVFVEKPLCIKPVELEMISDCVEELGDRCPLLMVGFNRRFAPATHRVRQFFEGTAPISVSYRFAPGFVPPDSWTQDIEVGGGRVVGEACHAIDTCIALTGSLPVKVFAESVSKPNSVATTDDSVFITLRHENGSVSNISYQSGGDRAFPSERIEVFGGQRVAVIDAWDQIHLWRGNRCKKLPGHKDKGHQAEFASFFKACREGGPWPISWDHLYASTWASLMAVSSLRQGMPVARAELIEPLAFEAKFHNHF
jgi:predicted dehydrogenase/threonine dehydrogenase-like Zn-dependent dehydrogenase